MLKKSVDRIELKIHEPDQIEMVNVNRRTKAGKTHWAIDFDPAHGILAQQ